LEDQEIIGEKKKKKKEKAQQQNCQPAHILKKITHNIPQSPCLCSVRSL